MTDLLRHSRAGGSGMRQHPLAGTVGVVSSSMLLLAHTDLIGDALGNASRAIGLALLLIFAVTRRTRARTVVTNPVGVLAWAGTAIFGLLFIMDPSRLSGIGAAVVFATTIGILFLLGQAEETVYLVRAALWTTSLFCVVSVALYLIAPSVAVGGQRLQGVFGNPNTLGFFCGIAVVAVMTGAIRAWAMLLSSVATIGLFLSASRTGFLALGAAALILAAWYCSRGYAVRVIGVMSGFAAISAISFAVPGTAERVFRTVNSREEGTSYVLDSLDLKWFGGVGYNGEAVQIASTPLRVLAQAGYGAAIFVMLAYAGVLIVSCYIGPRTAAIAVYGVSSSLLEGWYFAGGSALFVMYWLLYLAVAQMEGSYSRTAGGERTVRQPSPKTPAVN